MEPVLEGECAPNLSKVTEDVALEDLILGNEPQNMDGCCYSDPCPGWGTYRVSCCENGCSAYSNYVWCPSGDVFCPDPCADNGICNANCSNDPDCQGSCPPLAMECPGPGYCNPGYYCNSNGCCVQ